MNTMRKIWNGPGGYKEVFLLSLPLIISTGSMNLQMFIDRVFLMHYNSNAMVGAMQGGLVSFTIISLFFGTVQYVNTFVAQYYGAGRNERVSQSVWQGVYFSIFTGLCMLAVIPFTDLIFDTIKHAPEIRAFEKTYFRIITLGSPMMLMASSLACFFSGLGRTRVVMYVRIAGTVVNICLDYLLIFGHLGFPKLGVTGAAIATISSSTFCVIVFAVLFFSRENRETFSTSTGYRLDKELLYRMIRFGVPNGLQFMLDMMAFSAFISFIGRINSSALTATTIAFQIDMITFMPMIGLGIGLSTIVGQSLGRDDVACAQRATWSACGMAFTYMGLFSLGFCFIPQVFTRPFADQGNMQVVTEIIPIVNTLLKYVALYCLFNTGNIIFSATLKGAGDTRFVMIISVTMHFLLVLVPSYIGFKLQWSLYRYWTFFTFFVCVLSIVFLIRFLSGKWKTMRVIESKRATILPPLDEITAGESDLI